MKNDSKPIKTYCGGAPNFVDTYWCVVCQRELIADEYGVFVHENIPHPESMTFDEEVNPQ